MKDLPKCRDGCIQIRHTSNCPNNDAIPTNFPQDLETTWEKEFEDKFPDAECSAHDKDSMASCICDELPDINEERHDIKHFISQVEKQSYEKGRQSILEQRPNVMNAQCQCGLKLTKSHADGFACGWNEYAKSLRSQLTKQQ